MNEILSDLDKKILFDPIVRVKACENDFRLFFLWYFSKYLTHYPADFHKEMDKDLEFKGFRYLMWCMFRESAKTAKIRAYIVWNIVYKKRHNIYWDSADNEKSGNNARAIANELQSNEKIIKDFGQLYFEEEGTKRRKSDPKKIVKFKTVNGVLLTAISINVSIRGNLEEQYRPDLFVFDDFENAMTKKSFKVTRRALTHIDECITGSAAGCRFIFLCNLISNHGSVAQLLKRAKNNQNWKVRMVALIENGKLTWPAKWVMTAKMQEKINSTRPAHKMVKSVEEERNNIGTALLNQEFMNIPIGDEERFVKREWYTNGRGYYKRSVIFKDEHANWIWDRNGKRIVGVSFAGIDPAISKKESSDDRAIVSIIRFYADKQYYYFILKSKAGKWTLNEFTNTLKDVVLFSICRQVGVESNGVQQVFREVFANAGISTVPCMPDGDKVRRLSKHLADFEFGRVLFPDDGSCDDLLDELINFTGEDGLPDNRVDACVYALNLAKMSDYTKTEQNSEKQVVGDILGKEF